jgi:hypothetical protein
MNSNTIATIIAANEAIARNSVIGKFPIELQGENVAVKATKEVEILIRPGEKNYQYLKRAATRRLKGY